MVPRCPNGAITSYSKKAEVIYEREGKMILPPLSPDTPAKSLKEIFKSIRDNMGKKGKAAMKKYISDSGLQEESEAMKLLKIVFKSPKGTMKRKKKPTRQMINIDYTTQRKRRQPTRQAQTTTVPTASP